MVSARTAPDADRPLTLAGQAATLARDVWPLAGGINHAVSRPSLSRRELQGYLDHLDLAIGRAEVLRRELAALIETVDAAEPR